MYLCLKNSSPIDICSDVTRAFFAIFVLAALLCCLHHPSLMNQPHLWCPSEHSLRELMGHSGFPT